MAQGNQQGAGGFWQTVRNDRLGMAIVGLGVLVLSYRLLQGYGPAAGIMEEVQAPAVSGSRPGFLSGLFQGVIGVIGPFALLVVVARVLWNILCSVVLYVIGITIVIYFMYLMY